ncbi:kinase-like protein [Coniochaeta ligniaria NRRL 30616]|uniref:Kinase-like protein n=1 Tax=Coniochaeta ligniaria NRRL 30616 TaxID=1408157 RepID=A0A1J7IS58_9PEZI|nr:kinase-like protein [Coniochaeta ligniaria NRRL 30616]
MKYRIGKKIGVRSFGIEPRKTDVPQLRDEYWNYKILQGRKVIRGVHYFGRLFLHDVLIIDLLGESLEQLFRRCRRKFPLKTVVSLAQQMLLRIEDVHETRSDLVFRDIKPANFLLGRPGTPRAETVHLIDVGMAKKYRDPETRQHIPYREGRSLAGTARYEQQSRRYDMEALEARSLPWQGIKAASDAQKYELIGMKKQEIPIKDLCKDLSNQFAEYFNYVRGLSFEDAPDYEYLEYIPHLPGEVLQWTMQNDWRTPKQPSSSQTSASRSSPTADNYGRSKPPSQRRLGELGAGRCRCRETQADASDERRRIAANDVSDEAITLSRTGARGRWASGP